MKILYIVEQTCRIILVNQQMENFSLQRQFSINSPFIVFPPSDSQARLQNLNYILSYNNQPHLPSHQVWSCSFVQQSHCCFFPKPRRWALLKLAYYPLIAQTQSLILFITVTMSTFLELSPFSKVNLKICTSQSSELLAIFSAHRSTIHSCQPLILEQSCNLPQIPQFLFFF